MSHPLIAREGWLFILIALGVAIVASFTIGWIGSILCWIVFLFVLQFFRDPKRTVPSIEFAIVSPAHGKVVAINEVEDPYLKRPARRVSVFMNVFSIHSNRAPVGGVVMKRWYYPGRFFNAALDKASTQNERNAIWIRTAQGLDVVSVQIAGLIARRILVMLIVVIRSPVARDMASYDLAHELTYTCLWKQKLRCSWDNGFNLRVM